MVQPQAMLGACAVSQGVRGKTPGSGEESKKLKVTLGKMRRTMFSAWCKTEPMEGVESLAEQAAQETLLTASSMWVSR